MQRTYILMPYPSKWIYIISIEHVFKQHNFAVILGSYYRGARGVIIVFDVTNAVSDMDFSCQLASNHDLQGILREYHEMVARNG